ncbi:MAG TPA: PKD domain-containing protein, partial [Salegentibacter sp.]|nr:PKD domain-containing protein [Salegentibacter sp.]
MGKKLLSIFFIFSLFFLNSWDGFGQSCTDAPPTVAISTESETPVCDDETISFISTISPSTPSVAYIYQWQVSVNNSTWTNISGAENKDLTNYDPAIGSNRFRLLVTNCNGDSENESTEASPASAIITIYKKQEGSVTIKADKAAVCPGEEAVYSINTINNHGGSNAEYEWLLNGNPFSTPETGNTLTYAPSTNDEISLKVDSGIPCVDDFISTNSIILGIKNGTPAQPGPITPPPLVCPGEEGNYSISGVINATEYLWTLPDGTIETTTQSNINLTINSAGSHDLSVQAVNECGTSTKETISLTVNAGIPNKPGAISAPTLVCPGIEETYAVSPVPNAIDYLWTIPGESNPITTSTPEIKWTFNNPGQYNISVAARNDCGTGVEESLSINVNDGIPSTPTAINGPGEVCPGEIVTYSVTSDNTVTNYNWSVPAGWTITTNNGNQIEVTAGAYNQNGDISVIAENDCGNAAQTLPVEVKPGIPDQPEISGSLNACTGTEEIYSIDTVNFSEEYTWVFPSGWNVNNSGSNEITVAAGITSVNVIPGSNGGAVSVTAKNSCGESTAATETLSIQDPAPQAPGSIIFPNSGDEEGNKVCMGEEGTYSFASVPTATEYIWSLPNGTTETTTVPELNYTANTAGTLSLSVTAKNNCGESAETEFQIEVTDGVPAQPGEITSTSYLLCPPATLSLSVPKDEDVLSYEWFLPTGWQITGGENTNSITVNVSASVQYSNPVVV